MTLGEYYFGELMNLTDFPAVRFQIEINIAAPTSNLASVEAMFSQFGNITFPLPCTIVDAGDAIFDIDKVDAEDFTIVQGDHDFTVVCTYANGDVIPYIYTENSVNIIRKPITEA